MTHSVFCIRNTKPERDTETKTDEAVAPANGSTPPLLQFSGNVEHIDIIAQSVLCQASNQSLSSLYPLLTCGVCAAIAWSKAVADNRPGD